MRSSYRRFVAGSALAVCACGGVAGATPVGVPGVSEKASSSLEHLVTTNVTITTAPLSVNAPPHRTALSVQSVNASAISRLSTLVVASTTGGTIATASLSAYAPGGLVPTQALSAYAPGGGFSLIVSPLSVVAPKARGANAVGIVGSINPSLLAGRLGLLSVTSTVVTISLTATAPGGTLTTQMLSAYSPGGNYTLPIRSLSANAPGGRAGSSLPILGSIGVSSETTRFGVVALSGGGTIPTTPLMVNAPGGIFTTQQLAAYAPGGTFAFTVAPLSAAAPTTRGVPFTATLANAGQASRFVALAGGSVTMTLATDSLTANAPGGTITTVPLTANAPNR